MKLSKLTDRVWRVAPALLLPLFLGACASTFTATINTPADTVVAQQGLLPLRAAILVSPQDQAYVGRPEKVSGVLIYRREKAKISPEAGV